MNESRDETESHDCLLVSKKHTPTPLERFQSMSPFYAIDGYGEMLARDGRAPERRKKLDLRETEVIHQQLHFLADHVQDKPEISITYFLRDPYFMGGVYVSKTGNLKKIDFHCHYLLYTNGTLILLKDISKIEGGIFDRTENEYV